MFSQPRTTGSLKPNNGSSRTTTRSISTRKGAITKANAEGATRPCYLLDKIPPELRLMIYECLFPNTIIFATVAGRRIRIDRIDLPRKGTHSRFAILRTCKTTQAEALPILYRNTAFSLFVANYNDKTFCTNSTGTDLSGLFHHLQRVQFNINITQDLAASTAKTTMSTVAALISTKQPPKIFLRVWVGKGQKETLKSLFEPFEGLEASGKLNIHLSFYGGEDEVVVELVKTLGATRVNVDYKV